VSRTPDALAGTFLPLYFINRGRIQIQVRYHKFGWKMPQPVGQREVLKLIGSKHLKKHQIGIAGVLYVGLNLARADVTLHSHRFFRTLGAGLSCA
jgi:hypothetical protein